MLLLRGFGAWPPWSLKRVFVTWWHHTREHLWCMNAWIRTNTHRPTRTTSSIEYTCPTQIPCRKKHVGCLGMRRTYRVSCPQMSYFYWSTIGITTNCWGSRNNFIPAFCSIGAFLFWLFRGPGQDVNREQGTGHQGTGKRALNDQIVMWVIMMRVNDYSVL